MTMNVGATLHFSLTDLLVHMYTASLTDEDDAVTEQAARHLAHHTSFSLELRQH